jgi:predicted ATPase
MGLHTGSAEILPDGKYEGYATIASAQRVMSAAHGGQTLITQTTYDLLQNALPNNVTLRDMGEHRLKDLRAPLRLYQVNAPDLQQDFPAIKSLDAQPNNLPAQLTSFIGRAKEKTEATALLANTRMLTFIGPGGTGKTRLSLQLADEQLDQFKDGVWFIELAPIMDSAYMISAVASTFGLREVQGVPLLNIVMDYLRGKQLLVVLDNCEHLVEACAKLANQLLHECPKLKIIASSREALGISGETVYRVPSLSMPAPGGIPAAGDSGLSKILEYESTRLFVERATKAEPRFHLTEDNASFVAQICSRLDGIPLAIELAAARVKLFSPQQIAERLDDRFKLLTGGSRTALPRQQTLRALIDWSYQTLNETEQRALRRLATFSGGWTIEAAEAVIGESEAFDGLAGLVNKSLVNVEEQNGASRYRFLETIRQYAMDKLLESDETISARDNHLNYYSKFAEYLDEKLRDERKKRWIDQFELENDNFRSALRWSSERDPRGALKLIWSLTDFWLASGRLEEGQIWCKMALSAAENSLPITPEMENLRARALHCFAGLANNHGEHHKAVEAIEKAIVIFRQLGDTELLARSLMVLGTASGFSGDIKKAFDSLHESEKVSREMGHKFELAWALMSLSMILFETRGIEARNEIDAYMQETIVLLQEVKHPWGNYFSKEYLARQAFVRGDIVTARMYANEVLVAYQEAGSTLLATNYKSNMAHALRRIGNLAEAIPLYRETISTYQNLGHRGAIAHQLECFAFIAIRQEQGERAVQLLSAADGLRERSNSRRTPQEQMEYDKQIVDLRVGLGEEIFTQCWNEGKSMTMEQAIELAMQE